jgi:uncharacterized membrane protein YphA (DoxX/SURF4 family)
MNNLTRVFLVLLRLAIGWHFLFEGVEKLNSDSWTSEVYLREASGPAAPLFHWLAGDPLVERLTPLPHESDEGRTPDQQFFPPALARDWQAYFDAFVAYYELDPQQRELAQAKWEQAKGQTMVWLLNGQVKVKRESPWGPSVEVTRSTPQRLADYQKELALARRAQSEEMAQFGLSADHPLQKAKTEANRIRNELRNDLNRQTGEMKKALASVLTDAQKARDPMPDSLARPKWTERSRLEWIDWLTKGALTAIGICLLAGFLTRSACVGGALLLLMFFLAMPPFPGLPPNPRAEGHYLFVNKNLIEMLALLTLATTVSGRWLGVDGLIHFVLSLIGPANPPQPRLVPEEPERPVDLLPADDDLPRPLVHGGQQA